MAAPNPSEELKQQQAIVAEIKQQLQLYTELMTKKKEISQWDSRAKSAINDQINQWKAVNRSVDRVKKDLAEAEGELKSLSKESEKAAKSLQAQVKAADDLTDNFSELDSFQRSITRRYGEQSDETKRINKNVEAIKASVGGVGKFLKKNVNLEEDQADALNEASEYLKSMPSSFDRLNRQVSRGTLNQKKYNQYVAELNDNWEEILDKINDSGRGLGGMKKALREMGKAQGLSGEASQRYEQLIKFEEKQKQSSVITGAALSGIPGGEGLNQLLEARVKEKTGYKSEAKLSRTLAGAAFGAGATSFILAIREYIPGLSKQYYKLANYYAPLLAGRQEDVNIAQAKFNRDAKLFGGPLSKKYGKGFFYAAEAAKEFDFKMQSLNVEFNKVAKTAFFGRGIGSVGYNASQMQLAGVGAESVASAMNDIASGANVNFFGSKEGLGAQAAVFSKQMGISTSAVAEMMAAFRRIDGSSGKTALNMVYTSANMADIAKMNPAVILQDMAEASGKLLSYNIKNAKSFADQAIAIRKMGGNLPQFAKGIMGSIINYRQSLESQITLGNLIGRPVDFTTAQSLAYSGKYKEAFQSIKNSGVLEAVRKAGPLADYQFSQIFGMGLDDFQAAAENQGKSVGFNKTLKGETSSFLSRVSGAEKGAMVAEARITVTKAVVDAEFAKALAVGLNENPAYRNAVTSLDALSVASQRLQSVLEAIVIGLGSALGAIAFTPSILRRMGPTGTTAPAPGGTSTPVGAFAPGGKFAGWKTTGTGANTMVRNAKGQFVSAAEAAEFKQASRVAKFAKYGKGVGTTLSVLGAGYDAYDRLQSGQSGVQTVAGVGGGMAGSYAMMRAVAPLASKMPKNVYGLVGAGVLELAAGTLGYFGGSGIMDKLTGADEVQKTNAQNTAYQPTPEEIQTLSDAPSRMVTALENIEILMIDMIAIQSKYVNSSQDLKLYLDGATLAKSMIRSQLNTKGMVPGTTLANALGINAK
jgi:hypothetical protein